MRAKLLSQVALSGAAFRSKVGSTSSLATPPFSVLLAFPHAKFPCHPCPALSSRRRTFLPSWSAICARWRPIKRIVHDAEDTNILREDSRIERRAAKRDIMRRHLLSSHLSSYVAANVRKTGPTELFYSATRSIRQRVAGHVPVYSRRDADLYETTVKLRRLRAILKTYGERRESGNLVSQRGTFSSR